MAKHGDGPGGGAGPAQNANGSSANATDVALGEPSFLSGANAAYLDAQLAQYRRDPSAVSSEWRAFFDNYEDAGAETGALEPSWRRPDWPPARNGDLTSALDGDWSAAERAVEAKISARRPAASTDEIKRATQDTLSALMLIRAYRARGHLIAALDPLDLSDKKVHPELDPTFYGFIEEDLDRPIFIDMVLGLETATLREILEIVRRTYCGTFAVEFMHITDPEQKAWLQQRIEGPDKDISFTQEGKHAILRKIIEAEGFENFLHTKYVGTKRFGLDGAEAMVPALEQIIKRGGALGVQEIVIGMPHRGRLNVLAAVMGKPYHQIFHEFQGGSVTPEDVGGSGDVKYHLGASSDREFDGNRVHLSLTANPSHLEAVDPVVLGKARSKQDRIAPSGVEAPRTHVLPLLLHGDAAFAGQGVGRRVLLLFRTAGLSLRRDHPLHRQQPDRLYDRAEVRALVALPVRRGENGRGADLPRERRRSGGRDLRRQGRHGISPEIRRGTSSSTCSAIAASATMRATSRVSPSP